MKGGATEQGKEVSVPPSPDISLERHYSIQEVSKLWGVSTKKVRTLFKREPGVLEFGGKGSRFKRGYVTRQIPESVLMRVHTRLRKSE
jgi:hypothetical protein